eukprot:scaffold39910_cov36-Phaeocystis_antarctica.AAC.1
MKTWRRWLARLHRGQHDERVTHPRCCERRRRHAPTRAPYLRLRREERRGIVFSAEHDPSSPSQSEVRGSRRRVAPPTLAIKLQNILKGVGGSPWHRE